MGIRVVVMALFAALLFAETVLAQAPTGAETRPPILQFILAGAALALILTILMMPTRKA